MPGFLLRGSHIVYKFKSPIMSNFIKENSKIVFFFTYLTLYLGDTINTGPGTRGPGTQGPEDPRTGDPRTQILEGCVGLLQFKYNYAGCQCQCYVPNSQLCLVRGREGVIYSRQRYSLTSFDPQSSLLSVLQSQACTPSQHTERESLETIRI